MEEDYLLPQNPFGGADSENDVEQEDYYHPRSPSDEADSQNDVEENYPH